MNLIIDIGNSKIKLAIFDSSRSIVFENFEIDNLENMIVQTIEKYPKINQIFVSSVKYSNKHILDIFPASKSLVLFDHNFKFPFKNLYKTPNSIGLDRLALVSAAFYKYPNQNVLVIDAGTCITYDFIDEKANYHGGAISPGLRMRYKSLNNQTSQLPLIQPFIPNNFIGNTTNKSIHSGVVFGVINEIQGTIVRYKNEYSDLIVVLTGGDTNFLYKQFKISIFAFPNFIFEGLNFLLEHNSKK